MFEFNLDYLNNLLLMFSGVLTGFIANTSVTTKAVENKPTEQNTNVILSLVITLGFYAAFGILVGLFLRIFFDLSLLEVGFVFLLSYLTYLLFNKQIKRLRLPFFLDVILYLWSFIVYYGITVSVLTQLNIFKKENENLYSFILCILFLFIPLVYKIINEKNKLQNNNFTIPQPPQSDTLKSAHEQLIKQGITDKNTRDKMIMTNLKNLQKKLDKLKNATPKEREKFRKEILKEINKSKK